MRTRTLLMHLAVAAFLLAPGAAPGQAFPGKPVRIILPFPPGGSADLLARSLAEALAGPLGQQVLVENRTGAAGIVGSDAVAKAPPDGHTIGLIPDPIFTIYSHVYAKLPFDPARDLVPIVQATTLSLAIFAHPSVPANSLRELVTLARAKPGVYAYGTPGNGTPMHLGGELIKQEAGIDLVHIPYRGGGPATTDALGGQVPIIIVGVGSGVQHARSGKLKALAVMDAKRVASLPDAPTVQESGFPGFDVSSWFGLFAPVGTPQAAIDRLAEETRRALANPALRERLATGGMEALGASGPELAARIARESARWAGVIRQAGIKVEQ